MKKIASLALMILVLCMLMPCRFVLQAQDEDGEVIQATFYSVTTRENATLEVQFNKHWFDDKASVYSHDLAKLSLGLATSAFRPKRSENNQENLDTVGVKTELEKEEEELKQYTQERIENILDTVMRNPNHRYWRICPLPAS